MLLTREATCTFPGLLITPSVLHGTRVYINSVYHLVILTTSENYVGITIVQTLTINLLTSIDPSYCQSNRLITPKTSDKNVF